MPRLTVDGKQRISSYYKGNDLSIKLWELDLYYAENYLLNATTIETDPNISVCKKLYSTDPDAFYVNNTADSEEDFGDSMLKKKTASYSGMFLSFPDISYEFTIPSAMFTKDDGYLCFCMTSYFTQDYTDHYGSYLAGSPIESRFITIYYTKNDTTVTLRSYYAEEKSKVIVYPDDDKLNGLEILLIVCGVVVGACIIAGVSVGVVRHKRKKAKTD